MAESPKKNSNGVVSLTVMINGKSIDEIYSLISVSITKAINKIPTSQVTMYDGDMPELEPKWEVRTHKALSAESRIHSMTAKRLSSTDSLLA